VLVSLREGSRERHASIMEKTAMPIGCYCVLKWPEPARNLTDMDGDAIVSLTLALSSFNNLDGVKVREQYKPGSRSLERSEQID